MPGDGSNLQSTVDKEEEKHSWPVMATERGGWWGVGGLDGSQKAESSW